MKNHSTWPLLTLAGALLAAGCQAPQAQETAANTDTGAAPATETPTEKPQPTEKTASSEKTAPNPALKYRVASPMNGAPADYLAALQKGKLAPPDVKTPVPDKARVVLDTSRGPITIELDGKAAPMHVRSFLYLVDKKFYDRTRFHRHDDLSGDGKGFIIQGGDPLSKNPATRKYAGMGGPGYEVPLEADNGLKHDKLVIAAARSQDPNSAGSQFYITQGATPFLDGGYTVFGKVVAGQEAALKLAQSDTLISAQREPAKKAPTP